MSTPTPPPPPPPPTGSTSTKDRVLAWAKAHPVWAVIAVIVALGIVTAPFTGGTDDPAADRPAAKETTSAKPSRSPAAADDQPASSSAAAEPEAKCEALTKTFLSTLRDGLRRKSDQITRGYIVPLNTKVDFFDHAAAVEVVRGSESAIVILALRGDQQSNIAVQATKPALKWFNWGEMATDGSPVAEARDLVEVSKAATQAESCLG